MHIHSTHNITYPFSLCAHVIRHDNGLKNCIYPRTLCDYITEYSFLIEFLDTHTDIYCKTNYTPNSATESKILYVFKILYTHTFNNEIT